MQGGLGILVRRELASALTARWFTAYAGIFVAAGLALAAFAGGDSMIYGYRGFARAFAGLVHLALLFVPLMALLPGTAAIADERESGALEYVLAQPVTFGEVYLGKWIGLGAALVLALTAGLGVSGAVAALRGVPIGLLVVLWVQVALLALGFAGLGLSLSAVTASRVRATTLAVVTWLIAVALGSLGLMLAFVRWGAPADVLTAWAFANPIEAFRMGIVSVLDPDLSLLGPVGGRIVARVGPYGATALATLSLVVWALVPGLLGLRRFSRPR